MSRLEELNFDFEVPTEIQVETVRTTKSRKEPPIDYEEVIPDIAVRGVDKPTEREGKLVEMMRREKGEPFEHYQARSKLSLKIYRLEKELGLNPVACIEMARLIMNKVRLGVSYDGKTELVIETVLTALE